MQPKTVLYIALGGLGLLVLAGLVKKGGGTAGGAAAAAGEAVGQAAVNVAAGTVVGAGQAVGIPKTDNTKCNAAIAAGNTMDASFYCPAGTFIRYLSGTLPAPVLDTSQLPPFDPGSGGNEW